MNEVVRSLMGQNSYYVFANAEGIGQQESLGDSPGGANSFNWILGHLVYWRNMLLRMAGLDPVWGEGEGEQYRGHPGERKPIDFDPGEALEIEQLTADLRQMQERLDGWLADDDERELPDKFLNLLLHEAYHAGQLGLLRRAFGRDGAI
jgi:hypothetical protein